MTGASRNSQFIKAPPDKVYAAFMDPAALLAWLPPGGMTGHIHDFDARAGGGYRMSLFYPQDEKTMHGKTAEKEDMVSVRFIELHPSRRILEAVNFHSADPALTGEMRIEIHFDPVRDGTKVTFVCTDIPPGIKPEDNETGTRQSLEQLAHYVEAEGSDHSG